MMGQKGIVQVTATISLFAKMQLIDTFENMQSKNITEKKIVSTARQSTKIAIIIKPQPNVYHCRFTAAQCKPYAFDVNIISNPTARIQSDINHRNKQKLKYFEVK